jgi:hypothetical protein
MSSLGTLVVIRRVAISGICLVKAELKVKERIWE